MVGVLLAILKSRFDIEAARLLKEFSEGLMLRKPSSPIELSPLSRELGNFVIYLE